MPEAVPPEAGEDAAWVSIDTPLGADALLVLLDDPERLMRVNPTWEFEEWQRPEGDRFAFRIRTHANQNVWSTSGDIERSADGLLLRFDEGIKASTRVRIEATDSGSRLWIIDDYSRLPLEERERRKDEVDPSLQQWGDALYRYLALWQRWSHVRLWRWYMERIWRPMSPLARRIVRLLFWVTVAELVLFLLLVGLLWSERVK